MEICTSLALRAAEILICGRSPVVAFILPFLRKVFAVAVISGLDNARWTSAVCHSSAMDQHRDFAMNKDLDRLAAEDNRGNAVAAMRSHDD
jgi:hypothetical protein